MSAYASVFLAGSLSHYASILEIPEGRVGALSDDRSAIVGLGGWCFIYEGSNNYRQAYVDDSSAHLGVGWARLIEDRQKRFLAQGMQFLQVIVPNKLSLLPEYFPEALRTDTSFILAELLRSAPDASLVLPLAEFRSESLRKVAYRRNDSHLSIAGNAALAGMMLDRLGCRLPALPPVECQRVEHPGDLGGKFNPPLVEQLAGPEWSSGLFRLDAMRKVNEAKADGLVASQVFINNEAPIDKTLVVFGNSFFALIPSWGLSPFFGALFREFHFVRSAAIDMEYCVRVGAQTVIAQTCERFLTLLPTDVGR